MNRRVLSYIGFLTVSNLLIALILGLLLLTTVDWWGPRLGHWLSVPESEQPSDALVVLSGSSLQRLPTAIRLYQQGVAPRLAITGYQGDPAAFPPDEAQLARDLAIGKGIPASAITLLRTSTTAEDARQIVSLAGQLGVRRVTVVSNWFHSRRAVCSVRQAAGGGGLDVQFVAAPSPFSPDNWWQSSAGLLDVSSELAKLVYYSLRYQLSLAGCLDGSLGLGRWAALLMLGCLFSFVSTALVRRLALRRHILDIPNERSAHVQPTPRGGGLAICGVTLGLFTVLLLLPGDLDPLAAAAYLVAGLAIALTGWLDDTRHLRVGVRLVIQLGSAALLLAVVGPVARVELPGLGLVSLGLPLGSVLTLLWLVGFTNMFNFMDGIDGIAGTEALVAGIGWFVVLVLHGETTLALLAGLVAATSLGFLFLNVPPARIFMGDVGSTFLGLTLAALPVLGFAETKDPRLGVAGVLLVLPFVFDASLTIVRRALRRENIFQAHRAHLYQRLIQIGYSHAQVTGLYGLLAAGSALAGLIYVGGSETAGLIAVGGAIGVHVALAFGVTLVVRSRRPLETPTVGEAAPGSR